MRKRALITGVTGQDGSYLCELLLTLGYEVFGLVRRNPESCPWVAQMASRVNFVYGDLRKTETLVTALHKAWPDEVYNLAGQVFVPVSWERPIETFDVNIGGLARILKWVEEKKSDTRVYQASSSEMYGNGGGVGGKCDELSPFCPTSPYGVSKFAAHQLVRIYRERGVFAVGGILFNHECVTGLTPVIIREHGVVDVVEAQELIPEYKCNPARVGRNQAFTRVFPETEIWDGKEFVRLKCATVSFRKSSNDHRLLSFESKGGIFEATAHHNCFNASGKKLPAVSIQAGSRVLLGDVAPLPSVGILTPEHAELFGLLVSDGSVGGNTRFSNRDKSLVRRAQELWTKCFLCEPKIQCLKTSKDSLWYNPRKPYLYFLVPMRPCDSTVKAWLREQFYTRSGLKRVPKLVLNGTIAVKEAFLRGYYAGDGLKNHFEKCSTNSPVLAQGLYLLYSSLGRRISLDNEHRDGHIYYGLYLAGTKDPRKGQHRRKDPAEIKRITVLPDALQLARRVISRDVLIDLETESGRFNAGIGRVIVANSPRRGKEMVTRKVATAVAYWAAGKDYTLELGNLDARRDWGFAGDYVRAMVSMLNAAKPVDYVVGTGDSYSIAELLNTACAVVGVQDWRSRIVLSERLQRKNEIRWLCADPRRIREDLGWTPTRDFRSLVAMMVTAEQVALTR